ncbi:MAG: SymE family type I addiction module toxin [Candidatus Binatia bacterium]
MTRKKRALLALAQEVVALYGDKAAQPTEAPVAPQAEAHSGPIHSRKLTISKTYDGRRAVPLLRLQGRWLERAGFPAGARVVVRVQERRIVLLGSGSGN